MKKTLYQKLITIYIFIGIIAFLFATAGGSHFVESYLEDELGDRFYHYAAQLASDENLLDLMAAKDVSHLKKLTDLLSSAEETDILILDSEKNILVHSSCQKTDTDQDIFSGQTSLPKFQKTDWQKASHQTGTFYGYYPQSYLSVVYPAEKENICLGYISLHYEMQKLYQKRSGLLWILQMVFLVVYALCGLLLLCYRRWIHVPMKQISKGAAEYANGNLSYRIPVKSEDEMGYLSQTLNYMADKINQNGEYQRTFIANVSHDFRSPLTSIKGYVEAILDGTIPPELQEKYLKIISHEADRLEKLTRSLLVLNDLDEHKRMMNIRRFDINDVIKNTANTFEGTCSRKNIELQLFLCGKELFVEADLEQIQQVLYNLLDNAIKFSYDNSSIIIETTVKNGKVFVSVKDHGVGIPKESLSKVWDRFYKTDSSRGKDRKGTGLGLSIVKEIIRAHNQNINVISTVGVGTEFIFTLEKAK